MKNQLSLSSLLITTCLLLCFPLEAQVSKKVDVATAGTLPTLIAASEKDQITHLTVTGNLNGTDIRYIREMAERDKYKKETSEKLSVLDLSQANIVAGGNHYFVDGFILGEESIHKTSDRVIGSHMFEKCWGLTEIVLPVSTTSIGKSAFQSCIGLTSITIPDNVKTIDDEAFNSCGALTSVTIGNHVTSIGNRAFEFCSGLTYVTIGSGVTSIGNRAFSGCKRLKEFRVSEENTSYCQIDGALYSKDKIALVACPATNTYEYIIPNSVTSIENGAFEGCAGLRSITIPNSVTSIGEYAFSHCGGLTSITIPNSITSIARGTFYYSAGLRSITIPNSVTSIGNDAFTGCAGLTSITIPNSVISIGEYAFSGCDGLSSIIIPNCVTLIANGTFSNCGGLTSLTIPNSVTSIGSYVFSGFSIKQIHCEASTPPSLGRSRPFTIDTDISDQLKAYYTFLKKCKIYVPKGSLSAYKTSEHWKDFSIIIEE